MILIGLGSDGWPFGRLAVDVDSDDDRCDLFM